MRPSDWAASSRARRERKPSARLIGVSPTQGVAIRAAGEIVRAAHQTVAGARPHLTALCLAERRTLSSAPEKSYGCAGGAPPCASVSPSFPILRLEATVAGHEEQAP